MADALTLPTRLRISFPPHTQVLERELEPRTIAALQEDAARAYEEYFSCELAPGNHFKLFLLLESDPKATRVALQRERQLARYITVDDSELFVVLRVQAEPFEEGLAGEVKEPESFGEVAPRQPGSAPQVALLPASSDAVDVDSLLDRAESATDGIVMVKEASAVPAANIDQSTSGPPLLLQSASEPPGSASLDACAAPPFGLVSATATAAASASSKIESGSQVLAADSAASPLSSAHSPTAGAAATASAFSTGASTSFRLVSFAPQQSSSTVTVPFVRIPPASAASSPLSQASSASVSTPSRAATNSTFPVSTPSSSSASLSFATPLRPDSPAFVPSVHTSSGSASAAKASRTGSGSSPPPSSHASSSSSSASAIAPSCSAPLRSTHVPFRTVSPLPLSSSSDATSSTRAVATTVTPQPQPRLVQPPTQRPSPSSSASHSSSRDSSSVMAAPTARKAHNISAHIDNSVCLPSGSGAAIVQDDEEETPDHDDFEWSHALDCKDELEKGDTLPLSSSSSIHGGSPSIATPIGVGHPAAVLSPSSTESPSSAASTLDFQRHSSPAFSFHSTDGDEDGDDDDDDEDQSASLASAITASAISPAVDAHLSSDQSSKESAATALLPPVSPKPGGGRKSKGARRPRPSAREKRRQREALLRAELQAGQPAIVMNRDGSTSSAAAAGSEFTGSFTHASGTNGMGSVSVCNVMADSSFGFVHASMPYTLAMPPFGPMHQSHHQYVLMLQQQLAIQNAQLQQYANMQPFLQSPLQSQHGVAYYNYAQSAAHPYAPPMTAAASPLLNSPPGSFKAPSASALANPQVPHADAQDSALYRNILAADDSAAAVAADKTAPVEAGIKATTGAAIAAATAATGSSGVPSPLPVLASPAISLPPASAATAALPALSLDTHPSVTAPYRAQTVGTIAETESSQRDQSHRLRDRCDQHDHRGTCSRAGCTFAHVCGEWTRRGACALHAATLGGRQSSSSSASALLSSAASASASSSSPFGSASASIGADASGNSSQCPFVHPCPLGDACPTMLWRRRQRQWQVQQRLNAGLTKDDPSTSLDDACHADADTIACQLEHVRAIRKCKFGSRASCAAPECVMLHKSDKNSGGNGAISDRPPEAASASHTSEMDRPMGAATSAAAAVSKAPSLHAGTLADMSHSASTAAGPLGSGSSVGAGKEDASTPAAAVCEFFNRRSGCLSMRTQSFICGRVHVCSECGASEHGAPLCPKARADAQTRQRGHAAAGTSNAWSR